MLASSFWTFLMLYLTEHDFYPAHKFEYVNLYIYVQDKCLIWTFYSKNIISFSILIVIRSRNCMPSSAENENVLKPWS